MTRYGPVSRPDLSDTPPEGGTRPGEAPGGLRNGMRTMPAMPNPAEKNEYIDDRLHKAAEIIWLFYEGAYAICEVDAPAAHFADAIPRLRAILQDPMNWDKDPDPNVPYEVYWRALEIMNLPRSLNAMSATHER